MACEFELLEIVFSAVCNETDPVYKKSKLIALELFKLKLFVARSPFTTIIFIENLTIDACVYVEWCAASSDNCRIRAV